MKDEIKEILKDLEFCSGVFDYTITPDRCSFLKDYITNLQERFNALLEAHKICDELEQEKQERIDKAIDKLYCYGEVFDGEILQKFQKDMLDTLKGEYNE